MTLRDMARRIGFGPGVAQMAHRVTERQTPLMPVVYIAHRLAGDWAGNTASARQFAERAARVGFAPVAPYLTLDGLLHEPADRDLGLAIDLAMIPHCDAMFVCGAIISEGMRTEMRAADAAGVLIRRVISPDDIDARLIALAHRPRRGRFRG